MTTTALQIIEQARIRHWAFVDVGLSDGAAILWLNQRQRHLLVRFHDELRGMIGSSVQVAATVSGALVGITSGGTPYYLTTVGDGFPLHLSAGGTPYVDTTDTPVTLDPFGQTGGTPGWPMPADAVALLAMVALDANNVVSPIMIVDESQRPVLPQRRLMAFMSGGRIVPIRATAVASASTSDAWSSVTAVQLTYVPLVTLAQLTDTVTLPAVLHEALIAGLAEVLSKQARQCTAAERAQFSNDARRAEDEISVIGFDIAGDIKAASVSYRG